MEKNLRIANQSLSKGQNSDSKKNQDISPKWPRNSKRREQPTLGGFKPENSRSISGKATTSGKTRNQTNFSYDKRSKQRPEAANPPLPASAASALDTTDEYDDDNEGAGLASSGNGARNSTVRYELNSVFSPGSKKQNLNHLLNFNYVPRERDQPIRFSKTGNHRSYAKKVTYNKEQYLQANCQFVVRAGEDYAPILATPDTLVDWAKIEQVHNFSSEEPQCPICLYQPVAAKMTKCGHIYCWPCILHYLALSDKTWRKCPICYDAIYVSDLRSCVLKPYHSYTVGEFVTFQLMRREKTSMKVENASEAAGKKHLLEVPLFNVNVGNTILTKLLLAGTPEILAIIDREQQELDNQIVIDGVDCPEIIFVQQALEQLKNRREDVLSGKTVVLAGEPHSLTRTSESSSGDSSDSTVAETPAELTEMDQAVPMDQISRAEFIIDEDNNFTLSDIDIVQTLSCASSDYYHFYQSTDGQPLFLHSMNTRMLQAMYGGLDKSPQKITGKIVHKDSSSMSEDLRKRLKYLQHLPICTQFEVVEVEFEPGVIGPEVLAQFKDEITHRRKDRQKRARAERIRERQIFAFNERQLGKSMAQSAKINIDSTKHFPSCGTSDSYDFSHEPALATSPSTSDSSPSPYPPSRTSWSKMLSTTTAASRWPSLSSGGPMNGPMATPPPKMIQVTGLKMTSMPTSSRRNRNRFGSESDYEESYDMDEARAPEATNNLASVIETALERVSLNSDVALSEKGTGKQKDTVTNNTGAKKKKNKKTVLFASGMNLN